MGAAAELDELILPFIYTCLAVGVFVMWIRSRIERERHALVAKWAEHHDLGFRTAASADVWPRISPFSWFEKGDNHAVHDVLTTDRARRPLWCFEHSYDRHSSDGEGGTDTTTHWSSNVLFEVKASLDLVEVRPERWLDKLAAVVGFDDIDFGGDEFSSRYHVKSASAPWARRVINARVRYVLLETPTRIQLALGGRHVLVQRTERIGPHHWDELIDIGTRLLDALPQDLIGPGPAAS